MWCSVANYHLRNILTIRKYLTQDSAQILIHAFISSKLDYCNSPLYGIPKYLVCSEYGSSHCHIIREVWFDYSNNVQATLAPCTRIIFKLLLLVYKALNGKVPSYISSLLSNRRCSRSLHSNGQEPFTVPLAKLKLLIWADVRGEGTRDAHLRMSAGEAKRNIAI